jgi:diadenosine tetraphosphate (Ap4A) HIT family hydrolase
MKKINLTAHFLNMKRKDNTKTYIHIDQSRLPHQKVVMEKILEDGVCPFCPDHLLKYHKEPILKDGKFWILTKNQWPYENTKHHFLAIHKDHINHLSELTPEAGLELIEFFTWVSKEYNLPGGAMAMRFGSNPDHGNYGSSVLHLHAHLIEADLQNPSGEPVKFKIGQPHKKD